MLIEHAKIIRKLLKKHFPGVKFSVVSSRFAGGDAIHIHPKSHIFDPELHRELYFTFSATAAGQFDGMTDSYTYTATGSSMERNTSHLTGLMGICLCSGSTGLSLIASRTIPITR